MVLVGEVKGDGDDERNGNAEGDGIGEEAAMLAAQGSSTHAGKEIKPLPFFIFFRPKHFSKALSE